MAYMVCQMLMSVKEQKKTEKRNKDCPWGGQHLCHSIEEDWRRRQLSKCMQVVRDELCVQQQVQSLCGTQVHSWRLRGKAKSLGWLEKNSWREEGPWGQICKRAWEGHIGSSPLPGFGFLLAVKHFECNGSMGHVPFQHDLAFCYIEKSWKWPRMEAEQTVRRPLQQANSDSLAQISGYQQKDLVESLDPFWRHHPSNVPLNWRIICRVRREQKESKLISKFWAWTTWKMDFPAPGARKAMKE